MSTSDRQRWFSCCWKAALLLSLLVACVLGWLWLAGRTSVTLAELVAKHGDPFLAVEHVRAEREGWSPGHELTVVQVELKAFAETSVRPATLILTDEPLLPGFAEQRTAEMAERGLSRSTIQWLGWASVTVVDIGPDGEVLGHQSYWTGSLVLELSSHED